MEKKSDLKVKKKKNKKAGDGDKSDKEDEDEAKTRNAKFKELKESRQQKQRGEDVYTLGAEAKRLWEKVRREDYPERSSYSIFRLHIYKYSKIQWLNCCSNSVLKATFSVYIQSKIQ